jgi:single-stranded-DNA-specific exonuclease
MRARPHYRWRVAPEQPVLAQHLSREMGISQLLAQCLLNRGLSEIDAISQFLDPRLKHLADPFLLPGMGAAVDRLFAARQNGESLVIFGDYDVDGVTATTLLTESLNALGWRAAYYLPHRIEEGYGLSQAGVENCLRQHAVTLVLAVDCGSTAVESIAYLKSRAIDVIVLDHHQVCDPPPGTVALVNPQRAKAEERSFKELCSVGVAFKVLHALVKRGRDRGLQEFLDFDVRPFLDLVALGTIADVVPLVGENRILVTRGLDRLNHTTRPGLIALRDVAGIRGGIGSYEVGFQLAPRLNAAGRLENALDALHLLLSRDVAEARALAAKLDAQNRERQQIEKSIVAELTDRVRQSFDAAKDFVLVHGNASWHIGVVGIVAARVLQEFYRPTIVFGGDGEHWRGSGRSVEGFDLAGALKECSELLVKHGGHAMAAGVSILPDNVEAFRQRLNEVAARAIGNGKLQPSLNVDAEASLAELTVERVRELERLQQTGMGNPPVQFCVRALTHHRPLERFGPDKKHVRMRVADAGVVREAVLWNGGNGDLPVGEFDLVCAPQLNHYEGSTFVRLKVLDWRATAS